MMFDYKSNVTPVYTSFISAKVAKMSAPKSHVFVEACMVPMTGGLSTMGVYVPVAAMTVVQEAALVVANESSTTRGKSEDEMTAAELQAEEDGLLRWAERVRQKKLAKLALEQAQAEQLRTEQVQAVAEPVDDDSETEYEDLDGEEPSVEVLLKRERVARDAAARRLRADKRFEALPNGTNLRNRQELSDKTLNYKMCTKVAGSRKCKSGDTTTTLNAFAVQHRTELQAAGKLNRKNLNNTALLTFEYFTQGRWRALNHK